MVIFFQLDNAYAPLTSEPPNSGSIYKEIIEKSDLICIGRVE